MNRRILSVLVSLCLSAGVLMGCTSPQTAEPGEQQDTAQAIQSQGQTGSEDASQHDSGDGTLVDTDSVEPDTGELRNVHFDEKDGQSIVEWGREAVFRKRVLRAWDDYETVVDVSGLDLTVQNIDEMFQNEYVALLDCNAKYFYVKASVDYTYQLSTGELLSLTIQYKPEYCRNGVPDEVKIRSLQDQLETAINHVLECVSDEMSDMEVALALHDYLVRELDYDYESELAVSNGELDDFPEAVCTAAGALLNRTAVCQGYAQAYSNLLLRWGIESYIVTSRPMNHSWNLVCIEGKWYHVDVTWDDPVWEKYATGGYTLYYDGNNDALDEGYVQHTYFLQGDADMEALSYYGWTGKLPEAERYADFSEYCFYERNCALYWYEGYWYFSPEGREIYRAKIGERGTVYLKPEHRTRYTHAYAGYLYSTDGANLYRTAIDGSMDDVVLTALEDHIITEFSIKEKRLVYVLWDTEHDEYSRHTAQLASAEKASRVEGIKLDETAVGLTYGDTAQLTAAIVPEGQGGCVIRWRSSNPAVATVKNGLVTGLSNGKAVITAIAGGKTAECAVTVAQPAE